MRVFFLLAGIPDQMFTWLVHDTMMPVKKNGMWWTHGGFENMYGLYQSYSDIIVLLVLNWEHV